MTDPATHAHPGAKVTLNPIVIDDSFRSDLKNTSPKGGAIGILLSEYTDFIPIIGVAIDMILTVFFAGNLVFVKQYEANSFITFFAGFNSNVVLALGVFFGVVINIIFFYSLFFLAQKYDLREEYLFLAVSAFLGHVFGVFTWYGEELFGRSPWDWYLSSDILMSIMMIVCFVLVMKSISLGALKESMEYIRKKIRIVLP